MVGVDDSYVMELFKERGLEKYLLDSFVSRVTLEVVLSVEDAHLKIGTGRSFESALDNPFLRMKYKGVEVPVIPGSSLKGSLRSSLEGLAVSRGDLPLEVKVKVGEVEETVSCLGDSLGDSYSKMRKAKADDVRKNEDLNRCLTSPIVILFGAPWISGRTWISNFYPLDFSTTVLHRTAIDRLTMAVAHGKLHNVEVVEPGSTFFGKIVFNNVVPNPDGELVERYASEMLELLSEGLYVGGDKSRGGGLVTGKVVGGTIKKVENGKLKKYKITGYSNGKLEYEEVGS